MQLPPDWKEKAESTSARLMYPPGPNDGYHGQFDGDWRLGLSLWTQDFSARRPESGPGRAAFDSRSDAGSVEQPVNLEEGDECSLAVALRRAGRRMGFDRHQGQELREYLLRGGFFMADDFHGNAESWAEFERSMKLVFPDRPIVEIPELRPDLPHASSIWMTASRLWARSTCWRVRRMAARWRTGEAFTTIRAASW